MYISMKVLHDSVNGIGIRYKYIPKFLVHKLTFFGAVYCCNK